ncbi:MAG: F0F1 ATP synthase subunit alpha [Candidatus Paceibacterota bacterium]
MSNVEDITKALKDRIKQHQPKAETTEVGHVVSVGDSIARMSGLDNCISQEKLRFEDGTIGVALNLDKSTVGAIILGPFEHISEGDVVRRTGEVLSVPVGDALLSRTVSSLLEPIDEQGDISDTQLLPVETAAPAVMDRQPVSQPLQTGIKAIDAMVPIGRGQRELIIGDRQTGKTTLAIDTILNQKGKDVKCVYVSIGQKQSNVAQIRALLGRADALEYTTIVAANAADGAAAQYIAPYAATSQAEYLMNKGEDVLVVYDDLSKHAVAYREISLLLRRPPGREAYPGDVFYLHSRLLERSARLSDERGGGSITSLPIIETKAGDIGAYIPTNVISITDGQIYLESGLFNKGVRPAINTGNSVSRVGSAAQIPAMKKVAGKVRTQMAQFRELEAFTQFSSDLDTATKAKLERGLRIRELLKQPQYSPVAVGVQVVIFYAIREGYIDELAVETLADYQQQLVDYLQSTQRELLEDLAGDWTDELENRVEKVVKTFTDSYSVQVKKEDE